MKDTRKEELIACCKSIIRNAEDITKQLEFNQDLEVKMKFPCNEFPQVEIIRTMVPKEVIGILNFEDDTQ